jgi:hypothetical protein
VKQAKALPGAGRQEECLWQSSTLGKIHVFCRASALAATATNCRVMPDAPLVAGIAARSAFALARLSFPDSLIAL